MAYTKYHEDWKDYPDLSTPVDAAALEHMEAGIAAAVAAAEGASVSDAAVEAIVSDTGSATYAALGSTFALKSSSQVITGAWDFTTAPTVNGSPIGGEDITVGPTAPASGFWIEVPLPTVIPTAPTFTDPAGTSSDTYTIPSVTGVIYQIGGSAIAAGVYPGSGTVTIDAVPDTGYALTGTTTWTYTFDTGAGASSYGAAVLADSPAAYLTLDGDVVDEQGLFTGTATDITYGTGIGDGAQAAVLNGSTSGVSLGDVASLENLTTFTVEALVNPSSVTTKGVIVGRNARYIFRVQATGKLAFYHLGSGSTIFTESASSLVADTVYHVAAVFDGVDIRVYVNGVQSGTPTAVTASLGASADVHTLGKMYVGTADALGGSLAGVALYTTALSPTRIAAHATAAGV